MLFGDAESIDDWQAVENVADAPERQFEIAPAALFAALREERAGGRKIVGYWHSHPSSGATPSVTDAQMAAPDGKLWLIVAGAEVSLWRAAEAGGLHGRFEALAIDQRD